MEAGATWARGGLGSDDEPIKALEAFGVPEHVIAQARAAIESQPRLLPVLPEAWHACAVFVAMADQWRVVVGGMGGVYYQGLDLAALPVVMAGVKPLVPQHLRRPLSEVMQQLRDLSAGARSVLNG